MPSTYSKPATAETNKVPFVVEPCPVTLPVCPRCGHTGKNPGAQSVIYSCVGSGQMGTTHARTRMVEVTFRPDLEGLNG